MSKVLVTESYLMDIGDAIRNKNRSATEYKPSEMADAINDITTQDNTVLNRILDRSIWGNYVNDYSTEIGPYAFANCNNLTSVTFTKVANIDRSAFNGCTSLESINIPSTIQSIDKNAFEGTKITTINIDKPANSIPGAPWGATGALVYWQGKLAQYTEVDLNGGQWVDSGTQVDGHTVYKSDAGSYHTNYGKSICTVTVCGYSKVTVYATNYSESGYDYTEVGPLDGEVVRSSTANVLSTRFQNSKTDYKSYTFNLPDTNTHTFQILYSKDSGNDENDDRGYFYLTAE